MRNFAVYSVLTGSYQALNEYLPQKFPHTRFICVTDNSELRSAHWELKYVSNCQSLDSQRLSRKIKMQPWSFIDDIDDLLYIDNTVTLTKNPLEFYNELIKDKNIGLISHSFHKTLYEEMHSIISNHLSKPDEMIQWASFSPSLDPNYFDIKPVWGGIIARRRSQDSLDFGKEWWLEYSRSPSRDQLTLAVVVTRMSGEVFVSDHNNHESLFHVWPNNLRETRKNQSSHVPIDGSLHKLDLLNSFLSDSFRKSKENRRTFREQIAAVGSISKTKKCSMLYNLFKPIFLKPIEKTFKIVPHIWILFRNNPRIFVAKVLRSPLKACRSAVRLFKSGI
jgi:hypothetical protein